MSLSQTSDQRPVSTDNQIDRTNTTTNQETSFGESLASLLDDPNIISIHNVSNNDDAFNCIGAEDVVQTHLNYEQDPFTRIEVKQVTAKNMTIMNDTIQFHLHLLYHH